MSQRDINQGIEAIRNGNTEEGARLLRVGLKSDDLPPQLKAIAYQWLAETDDDLQFKIECYRKARQAAPNDDQINQRLSLLLSRQSPGEQGEQQQQQYAQSQRERKQQQPPPQDAYQDPYNPQQQDQQQWSNTPYNNQHRQEYDAPTHDQNQQQSNTPPPYAQGGQPAQPQQQPQNQDWQQQYNQPAQQQPQQPLQGQAGQPGQNQNWQQQQYNQPAQQQPQQQQPQQQQPQQQQPQQQQPQQFSGQQPLDQQPINIQGVQRSVGILGGPNGRGTGFFVTREGLVVTTRYVVGGNSDVDVELLDGRTMRGQIVRSYPEFDIALIQTPARLSALLNVVQSPLPDNASIVAVTHTGEGLRSSKRATRHQTASHWFPTLINRLLDAGGNPIFNANNLLVGMLTRNMSRTSGYLYGLYISKIYQSVQQYLQEKQQIVGQTIYCTACGIISRAPNYNAYYCEHCGNTHSYARGETTTRYPQEHFVNFYREDTQRPCPNCESRVGFYDGKCLRCGYEL